MFYYMYQITNTVNNKIYVGVHKTKSLDDGYMGSGKIIRSAIMKHGIDNFEKVILEYFEDSESMYAKEAIIVNDEFLLRRDVYNLRRGGYGGFDYINENNLNGFSDKDTAIKGACIVNKIRSKRHVEKLQDPSYRESWIRAKIVSGQKYYDDGGINPMQDKHHTSDTKALMSASKSGDKNPNSGKMWITNDIESKMIYKTDLIPNGYRKGRIQN